MSTLTAVRLEMKSTLVQWRLLYIVKHFYVVNVTHINLSRLNLATCGLTHWLCASELTHCICSM